MNEWVNLRSCGVGQGSKSLEEDFWILMDCRMLRDLSAAADYLEVNDLLRECGVRIGMALRNKSVKEINRFLRIRYDEDEDVFV